jgi:hypothetical protein
MSLTYLLKGTRKVICDTLTVYGLDVFEQCVPAFNLIIVKIYIVIIDKC